MNNNPMKANYGKARFEFTAGGLLCGKIRGFFECCRFKGMQIEWHESPGWIERDWIVQGEYKDVVTVYRAITKWIKDND